MLQEQITKMTETTSLVPDIHLEDSPEEIPAVRLGAKLVSYLFHPLFIPAMATAVLLWLHPLNKLLIADFSKPRIFAMVFLYTAFFPAVSVFLLWRLKFIDSIFLRTRRERIIPFVIAMFFFFWIYYVSRNLETFPFSLKQLLLGVFICSASAMFANMYTKISMHGIGVGGLVGFAFIQQFRDLNWNQNWSVIALLLAGVVCTARLILHAHKPVDVYAGFFTGVICQVAASFMITP